MGDQALQTKGPVRCPAENQLMEYKNNLKASPGIITTGAGNPVGIEDAIQTVGPRGPATLQDFHFLDLMSHFDAERIPERVVNAKGAGAFGYFEVTHNITNFTAAKVFEKVKKRTPVAVRFSTTFGKNGSIDTVREPRGFAIKFYTEDGIWDLVGSNMPVYFVRDPKLFPAFVHSQKRNPQTHLKDPEMFWDFVSLRPETMHALLMMYSTRGCPDGYRYMHGYGVNAYKLVNARGEPIYAKFHLKSGQGVKHLESAKALEIAMENPDYAIADLFNAIKAGCYPTWTMYIQVMTFDQAKKLPFNPFDATKVWSQKDFPLIRVGTLNLDRNPVNYFAEIEQLAFSPANMIPGFEPSPDKMLQGRLFSYGDSQRHRLGPNYLQIPVNCPFKVRATNYQRDAAMSVNCNQGGAPNYYPNSYGGPVEDSRAKCLTTCCPVAGDAYCFSSGETEDNYDQATDFWVNVLNDFDRVQLVQNLCSDLKEASPTMQERMICNLKMVHAELSKMVGDGLKPDTKGNSTK